MLIVKEICKKNVKNLAHPEYLGLKYSAHFVRTLESTLMLWWCYWTGLSVQILLSKIFWPNLYTLFCQKFKKKFNCFLFIFNSFQFFKNFFNFFQFFSFFSNVFNFFQFFFNFFQILKHIYFEVIFLSKIFQIFFRKFSITF